MWLLVLVGGCEPHLCGLCHLTKDGADDDQGPPQGDRCNLLTQTGCNAGEKCTWIHDQLMPPVAHIDCAPDGVVAVGGACSYGMPPMGWDDCDRGTVCIGGACDPVCDQGGGAPQCDAGRACVVVSGFLGPPGAEAAGICELSCDPLADNDALGSGSRAGSACRADQGCFGFWGSASPSQFWCSTPRTELVHRSICDAASGCMNDYQQPYTDGCASGYIPIIASDLPGTNSVVCLAFCSPGDCYAGSCGSNDDARIGAAPHRCNDTDARGTFDTGTNGDQCVYGWRFEVGSDGKVRRSAFSDTTGLCMDHTDYHLTDRTGNYVSSTPWPACSTLPLTAAGSNCYGAYGGQPADLSGCTAVDFGCVSTTTGGVPTARVRPPLRPMYQAGHRVDGDARSR